VTPLKKLAAELITIVLGVLIALGVDDWRQGREELAIAREHLVDLTGELRGNLCTVERIRERAVTRKLDNLQTVIAFLNDPAPKVEDPEALLKAFANSGGTSLPWLVDNQYQALQNSGNVRLVRRLHPTLRVGAIYEAPEVLFSQAERIQGNYPAVVNELLPAQLQPQLSSLRGYVRDNTILAPAVADDPDLAKAIENIHARRAELLPLARGEVAATTARWYALVRLSNEMTILLGELKQWDQATEPLEKDLEECRAASPRAVQERLAVDAAAKTK
jgi:hypothetical protein